MKLDDGTGEVLWSLQYASAGAENESVYAMALDAAGNAYITGRAWISGHEDEFATFRVGADDGEIDWDSTEGGADELDDLGLDIAIDPNGDPVAVGLLRNSDGSADFMVVKYDAASGGTWWSDHAFELVSDSSGDGWVEIDAAGDVIACCKSWGSTTGYDITLIKYDGDDGSVIWSRVWSNGSEADDPADMMLDAAGAPVVVGVSDGDYLVVKFDNATGAPLWFTTYDGPRGWYDTATCVVDGAAGEILVSGYSEGLTSGWDMATLGFVSETGDLMWTLRHDGMDSLTDAAADLVLGPDGDLLVAGYGYGSATSKDMVLVSYAYEPTVGVPPMPVSELVLRGVPNPFNPAAVLSFELPEAAAVELAIFDPAGRRVATPLDGTAPAGVTRVRWDGRDDAGKSLPSGVYFARVESEGHRGVTKMLLAK